MFPGGSEAQGNPPHEVVTAQVLVFYGNDDKPFVSIPKDIANTQKGLQIKEGILETNAYNVPQEMKDDAENCRLLLYVDESQNPMEISNDEPLCAYQQFFEGRRITLNILPPNAVFDSGVRDDLATMGVRHSARVGQQPQEEDLTIEGD